MVKPVESTTKCPLGGYSDYGTGRVGTSPEFNALESRKDLFLILKSHSVRLNTGGGVGAGV